LSDQDSKNLLGDYPIKGPDGLNLNSKISNAIEVMT